MSHKVGWDRRLFPKSETRERKPFDFFSISARSELRQEYSRLVSFLDALFDPELSRGAALDSRKRVWLKAKNPPDSRIIGMLEDRIELNQLLMRELVNNDVARQITAELRRIEGRVLEAQKKGLKAIRVKHENLDRIWIYEPVPNQLLWQ